MHVVYTLHAVIGLARKAAFYISGVRVTKYETIPFN